MVRRVARFRCPGRVRASRRAAIGAFGAVDRARYRQTSRKWIGFVRIGEVLPDSGVSARSGGGIAGAIGRPAGVIDHVDASGLVARGISLDRVPTEQREHLIEAGIAVQVGAVEVGETAVTEADVGGYQGQSGFGVVAEVRVTPSWGIGSGAGGAGGVMIGNAVAVLIEEAPGVNVRLPLVCRNLSQVNGVGIAG